MEDKTSWQKFCLFACCVMGAGLVWTSAESISSTFDFIGPQKAILYVVALVIVGLAVLGLRRIHGVFAEDVFVENRPWQLLSGVAIYTIALCASLASSVHGMYFRGVQGDLQTEESSVLYRDLSQLSNRTDSLIKTVTEKFNNEVEAQLLTTINEVLNQDNRGPGSRFEGHKRTLEQMLGGVQLAFVSSPDAFNSRPSQYAIGVFKAQVREIKSRILESRRNEGRELQSAIAANEFADVLARLNTLKTSFGTTDRAEAERLLRQAFVLRADLDKRLVRLATNLRMPAGADAAYPESPLSYQLKKVNVFWGRAFAALFTDVSPDVELHKLLWAILFGVILEVGFASFYYFGFLERPRSY